MKLTEFLLARIAEDEEHATDYFDDDGTPGTWSRFLQAECEAKRAMIELRYSWNLQAERMPEPPFGPILEAQVSTADAIIRRFAAVYADHPDYREEWKP